MVINERVEAEELEEEEEGRGRRRRRKRSLSTTCCWPDTKLPTNISTTSSYWSFNQFKPNLHPV